MLKVGIVGTGKIVQELLPYHHQTNFLFTSILSTPHSYQYALQLSQTYHIKNVFTDYQKFLQSEIDVVYIALPNHLHFEFSKQALSFHKHVICEKPITTSFWELQTLLDIAQKNKVMLFEAMTLYHLPAYQKLKESISKIGPIRIINLNFSQYSSRYDAFLQGNILPAFDFKKAGGALMDLNVYNLHALVGLFGKPLRVQYFPNIQRHIDTSGILICTYPTFQATCIGAKDCQSSLPSSIQGEQGTIFIPCPVSTMTKFEIHYHNDQTEIFEVQKPYYRMIYEFQSFAQIIESNDTSQYQELCQLSLTACELLEHSRKSGNLSFLQ